jgi:hypothetical protein
VGAACRCPAGETTCGSAPGVCADLATDEAHCGTCTTACDTARTCTQGRCCLPRQLACSVGGTPTCCDGTACCPGGCQAAHSNGLGQPYFACAPLGTLSRESALLAAAAWSPSGGSDLDLVPGSCLARQRATDCATWCYLGVLAGRVRLNTVSSQCLIPDTLSPTWD